MQRVSPFTAIRNKGLSKEDIRSNIRVFVNNFLNGHDRCINPRNRRPTGCQCLDIFRRNEESLDQFIEKLVKYESKKPEERQLFLHGVLTHANLRKEELRRGEKKMAINAMTGVLDLEGETVHICNNALQCLLCIGPQTWKRIQKDALLPAPRSTENYENNVNKTSSCTQRIIDYLYELYRDEGESHATRIIRMETSIGVRDHNWTIMHLPSYYTKRKIYERFCFISGWEVKSASDGSYPPVTEFKERTNDHDCHGDDRLSLWPEGSESKPVCSWHTFLRCWKYYLPNLKIRPSSLDTCDLCNEYAKYISGLRMNQLDRFQSFLSNDPLICPDTGEDSLLSRGFGDLQESRENVVLLASEHVAAARAQKEFAQTKVDAADESLNESNPTKRTVTLVMDFCQNLDLPHLGGEQPGDTYYYSPVWLYCLGIVDVAEDRLYAYLYDESSAKKGANNVASILLYHVLTFVINNFEYGEKIHELNVIMDNCGGQNKNGTVLKMAAYLVERGWFNKVNLIFLVKGHTKNDCDRMFNLLKIKWHKSNVYTFQQALEILGTVDNVLPIDASNVHIDYATFFEKWYKQPASGTIQKNHIFTFDSTNIHDCIMTTKWSFNADVTSTQSIKKIDKNTPAWLRKLEILHKQKSFLAKPGLKPIKQVHLYTKWRKVVPHPFKDELCPLPSNEVIEMVVKKRPRRKQTASTINTTITPNVNINPTTTGAIPPTTTPVTTPIEPILATTFPTIPTPSTEPTQPSRGTTRSPQPPTEQETRTNHVANDVPAIDMNPVFLQDSDDGSEYIDDSFDPLELLIEDNVIRTRGKTFLPPKPAAVRTREQKMEKDKEIAESNKKTKDTKKQVTKRRMTTRNQKKLEREKKEPPSKRLRSRRQSYYSKHKNK